MLTASTAEWILCRVTSHERAASIVGDLVEIEEQKGLLWFWLSVAGVVFSLVWRQPLAFVAAFYAGAWTFFGFQMAIMGINAQHRPPEYPWMPVFTVLIFAGSMLCAVSLYAAIRYGVQDKVTQIAFAWTSLVTSVIYLWWQPVVLGLCITAALLIVSVSIFNSKLRKEALVVLVSVVIGSVLRFFVGLLAGLYQHFLLRGPWGTREMQEHPSLEWVVFCMLILTFWASTSAWSRMHNWLMRDQAIDTESEGKPAV